MTGADEPLQIRAHPVMAVMGAVIAVGAITKLIWSEGGAWSSTFHLWQLLTGSGMFLYWYTAVLHVHADRIQVRSMVRAETFRFEEFSIRPAPFPRSKGRYAKRAFKGLASLDVVGRHDIVYLPLAVESSVLQLAIDQARGLVPPAELRSFRTFFGADFRYGRVEGWLRTKVLS